MIPASGTLGIKEHKAEPLADLRAAEHARRAAHYNLKLRPLSRASMAAEVCRVVVIHDLSSTSEFALLPHTSDSSLLLTRPLSTHCCCRHLLLLRRLAAAVLT